MWHQCLRPSLAHSDLGFGGRSGLQIFKMVAGNDFSNSKSLFYSDASHQVSAQSYLRFGRRCRLKNLKMAAAMAAILDSRT